MEDRRQEVYRVVRDAILAARGENVVPFRPGQARQGPRRATRHWARWGVWSALWLLLLLPVSFDLTQDQCPPQASAPAVSLSEPPAACATPPEGGGLFGFRGCATLTR